MTKESITKELDMLRERLTSKLQVKPLKPRVPSDVWLHWLSKYRTPQELEELNELLKYSGNYLYGSNEYQLLKHHIELLNESAENRATADKVSKWPSELQRDEQAWRTWKAWEQSHPVEWVNPMLPPGPNTVHVSYWKGCVPKRLVVPVLTTVTWVSHEYSPVAGHWIRHVPHEPARERLFESPEIGTGESWSHTFTEPGIFEYCCIHKREKCGLSALIVVLAAGETLESAIVEYEQSRKVLPRVPGLLAQSA